MDFNHIQSKSPPHLRAMTFWGSQIEVLWDSLLLIEWKLQQLFSWLILPVNFTRCAFANFWNDFQRASANILQKTNPALLACKEVAARSSVRAIAQQSISQSSENKGNGLRDTHRIDAAEPSSGIRRTRDFDILVCGTLSWFTVDVHMSWLLFKNHIWRAASWLGEVPLK